MDATASDVKALLFDFDGLILDTETPIFEEWCAEFRRRGHDLSLAAWQRTIGSHGLFDPCAELERLTGEVFDHDALRAVVRERNLARCELQFVLPGVRERMQEARDAGLHTGVASSSSLGWVEGWLDRHGLRPLVETVCARDHVARVKPSPDLFLLAAERLRVGPASCLVLEDSPNGARAAAAAGMRCIAVPGAITRGLAFEGVIAVLDSLQHHGLPELLRLAAQAVSRP